MQDYQTTLGMSHQDWLNVRQTGIGSSDAPAILGLNPWQTPTDVYNDKISPEPIQIEENPKMKAGIMLEDVVAKWFTGEIVKNNPSFKIQRDNKIRKHKTIPFLLSNLDRVIVGADSPGILECKTTSSWMVKLWGDGVPLHYYAQIQHQLNVCGYKWGYIAVLVDGWDFKYYPIKHDHDYCKYAENLLKEFWNDNVLQQTPPDPISAKETLQQFPKSLIGTQIKATETIRKNWDDLVNVRSNKKSWSDKEEHLKEVLQIYMKDSEALMDGSDILATWKSDKDGFKFDESSFKKAHPDLHKKFLIDTPGSRRFLVKD